MLRACSLLFVFAAAAIAQPDTSWVRRYDGPGHGWDEPSVMKLVGNRVYVAGQSRGDGSGYDYAAVVYDLDGDELWSARYNGTGNGRDEITDLVVDSDGNVIVTGYSQASGGNPNWVTVKYDQSGDTIWLRRHNSGAGAAGVAVDDSGNVYVTGSAGSYPYVRLNTIRYSPNGTQHWLAEYYPPAPNRVNNPHTIAVDPNGCPVVAGGGTRDSTGHDILIIKYNPVTGESLWVARYTSPGDEGDAADVMVLDTSGNIYVTGYLHGGTDRDIITMKYSPDGTLLWLDTYDGPNNGSDAGVDIELGEDGNIYVAGNVNRASSNDDMAIIKYNPDGETLWVRLYNYPTNRTHRAYALALDGENNVYVCGYLWTGTSWDYLTVKYDTDGNEQWYVRFNTYESQEDEAYDIALDDSGFVYVTGRGKDSLNNFDYATIKYSQFSGIVAEPKVEVRRTNRPTIVRGVLFLDGGCPHTGAVPEAALLDISGRKVLDLKPGANDVRHLAPGVYFVTQQNVGCSKKVLVWE